MDNEWTLHAIWGAVVVAVVLIIAIAGASSAQTFVPRDCHDLCGEHRLLKATTTGCECVP